jgi:hypothetical protein
MMKVTATVTDRSFPPTETVELTLSGREYSFRRVGPRQYFACRFETMETQPKGRGFSLLWFKNTTVDAPFAAVKDGELWVNQQFDAALTLAE